MGREGREGVWKGRREGKRWVNGREKRKDGEEAARQDKGVGRVLQLGVKGEVDREGGMRVGEGGRWARYDY